MAKHKAPQPEVIEAAGGLLWRTIGGRPAIAILHRPGYGDWALPKGKREEGETWAAAALREVQEETNCKPRLGPFAGCTAYMVGESPKVVLFWHMTLVKERSFESNDETDRLLWLNVEEALAKLDYAGERELLRSSVSTRWIEDQPGTETG